MLFTSPVLHHKPVADKSVLARTLAIAVALPFSCSTGFARCVPGMPKINHPCNQSGGGGGVGIGIKTDVGSVVNR